MESGNSSTSAACKSALSSKMPTFLLFEPRSGHVRTQADPRAPIACKHTGLHPLRPLLHKPPTGGRRRHALVPVAGAGPLL